MDTAPTEPGTTVTDTIINGIVRADETTVGLSENSCFACDDEEYKYFPTNTTTGQKKKNIKKNIDFLADV